MVYPGTSARCGTAYEPVREVIVRVATWFHCSRWGRLAESDQVSAFNPEKRFVMDVCAAVLVVIVVVSAVGTVALTADDAAPDNFLSSLQDGEPFQFLNHGFASIG